MADTVGKTLELKQNQLDYLDEMAKKHSLSDRSQALRCLIACAIQESEHEASTFTIVRCAAC